jgi:2-methylcitrate dehydratase PrpD
MASAAMTARILDLDAAKTTNAVAIALSMTSGALGMPVGQSPRWLLLGFEARKGCAAALMANEGYAGDHTLLDGDWLMRMHGVSCDVRWLRPAGPAASAIDSISLKPYCAAKQCIAAIEAFRELLDGGITTDEISTVHVRVPRAYAAMIGHRHAANGRIPRMTSAAYSLALAAYKPTELRNISRTNLTADPQIAALMTRIEICPDDELSQHFPERWPARVDVLLKSGRTVSATVLDAPGDPSEPLGATGALEKFYRLTESIIGRRESLDLANACRGSTERDDSLARLCNWVTK